VSINKPLVCLILCLILLAELSFGGEPDSSWIINHIKHYPIHYLKGLQTCWKFPYQKNLYLAGTILIPISFLLDQHIANYIQQHKIYSNQVSQIGYIYGHRWGYYGTLATIILTNTATRQPIIKIIQEAELLIESELTTATVTAGLKTLTHRQRPNQKGYRSFPSGHTSSSFALAAVIKHLYGDLPGYLAYAMAAFVGSTRINDNKHYLSDVTSGAILGILIGRSFTHQHQLEWSMRPNPETRSINIDLEVAL
jgi:membrane-associated phospholipid phosphatase